MKRLRILFLAAGLGLAAMTPARAADVKISGEWDFNFEWSDASFNKGETADRFKPRQRLRTQVEILASESLKGIVQLEIGDTAWGSGADGTALGTDGREVKVRYSYVDWVVPQTDMRVRVGLQPFALPGLVAGSAVLDEDGAGITASYQVNDMAAVSAFWLRAENDNWGRRSNALDFVGFSLPVAGEGWQVNPWGMYGFMGKNSLWTDDSGRVAANEDLMVGLLPLGGQDHLSNKSSSKAWWLGMTVEVTFLDALHVAGDAVYGHADWGQSGEMDLRRAGWMLAGLMEYKLDVATPGLVFWYASGDDGNPNNGSERMPTVVPSWQSSTFGYDGAYGIADGAALGLSPTGTWGVAARITDISLLDKLTHTVLVGNNRGTNSKHMPRNSGLRDASMHYTEAGGETIGAVYLTTKDSAVEVNFDSQYALYEDLTLAVETGFIHLNLDRGVWGNVVDHTRENAWKVGVNLNYAF